MITEKDKIQWKQLMNMLRQACHARDCKRVSRCPNYCSCRRRRPFKLNTDTAVCWEMADSIRNIIRYNKITVRQREILSAKISTLATVTMYHSSRGWREFFNETTDIVNRLLDPDSYYLPVPPSEYIDRLKRRVNRLKREMR